MRLFKRISIAVVVLLIIAALAVYFNLNRIVKRTIEVQATDSLSLQTKVDSVSLGIFGGKLTIDDMQIASPQGFAAPQILSLDSGNVLVSYGELRGDPVRIKEVTLKKPTVVIEQVDGKFNFQVVASQMPKRDPASGQQGDGTRADDEPIRVIIDKLRVEDATVLLRPGLPGLSQELKVNVPTLELHDVGSGEGNKNGAAIKEVVVLLLTNLAQKGAEGSNIDALKGQLADAVKNVEQQARAELQKRLGGVTKQLEGATEKLKGTQLEGVGKDASKDISNALDKALGGADKKKDK